MIIFRPGLFSELSVRPGLARLELEEGLDRDDALDGPRVANDLPDLLGRVHDSGADKGLTAGVPWYFMDGDGRSGAVSRRGRNPSRRFAMESPPDYQGAPSG